MLLPLIARISENSAPKNINVMIKLFIRNLNALVILIEYGLPSVGGDVIPALMPDASLTAIVIYVSPEAEKMCSGFVFVLCNYVYRRPLNTVCR